MKKFLAITLAGLWNWCAQAQGSFTFSNRVQASGVNAPVFDAGGFSNLAGPNMVAAIFLNNVQLGPPAPFRTGAGAGYWNAGPDNLRVIDGKFSGDVVAGFTVLVWDLSRGLSFKASRDAGGKFGFSKVLRSPWVAPRRTPTSRPICPA